MDLTITIRDTLGSDDTEMKVFKDTKRWGFIT